MKEEVKDELKDAIAELLWKRQGTYYTSARCIIIEAASGSMDSCLGVMR